MRSLWLLFAILLLWTTSSCAPESREPKPLSLEQQVKMLADQGRNAEAIKLIESNLGERSDSQFGERLFLLATSYVGYSGVDVFSLIDLLESLLQKELDLGLVDEILIKRSEKGEPEAKYRIQVIVGAIDQFLGGMKRVSDFLVVLPKIDRGDWIHLEFAMGVMDEIPDIDINQRAYRVFVRTIYLKEFIRQNFIESIKVGTRSWFCTLSLEEFVWELEWLHDHLKKFEEDFNIVYAASDTGLTDMVFMIEDVLDAYDIFIRDSVVGTSLGVHFAEQGIKKAYACDVSLWEFDGGQLD